MIVEKYLKKGYNEMDLKENGSARINVYNGKMTIEKENQPKYNNLQERLKHFTINQLTKSMLSARRKLKWVLW